MRPEFEPMSTTANGRSSGAGSKAVSTPPMLPHPGGARWGGRSLTPEHPGPRIAAQVPPAPALNPEPSSTEATVRRLRPETTYLVYATGEGFAFHLMSVLFSVFLIVELRLGPLQLLLMGTVLELSYLLFEVPTGVVADTVSRRLSVVIGLVGSGAAFIAARAIGIVRGRDDLPGVVGVVRDVPERGRRRMAHRRDR